MRIQEAIAAIQAAALALSMLLAACAADAPVKPDAATIYVPTPYAVKEPCFKEEDRPKLPVHTFNSDAEIDAATPEQIVKGLHADRIEDCLYQAALERLFLACQQKAGTPVQELPPLQCGTTKEVKP